jgi:hypothetical protein
MSTLSSYLVIEGRKRINGFRPMTATPITAEIS